MSESNRVSAVLGDAEIAELRTQIAALRARLPFLVNLSPQDRKELPKLGDKTVGFDEKCQTYMESNPEFLPGFVDTAELDRDRALRSQMLRIAPDLLLLAEQIEDTLTVLGSEIVMVDFAYYQGVREAARRGLPGAQLIYDDLRTRFPGPGRPSLKTKT
ncbi:MAG TPA: hypothetical protein PLP53_07760 [Plasticicumulans sp.]|nr:hypothetical protein [Plasticicumulans sp.]HNF65505.1 hypothetical protein [Plasticicumulans sp.]